MNYTEYKNALREKGLIESFDSMLNVLNAERCQQNIKNILNWGDFTKGVMQEKGVNIEELLHYWNARKNAEVKIALSKAVNKEQVLSVWTEEEYEKELKELKGKLEPTVASVTDKLEKRK